MNPRGLLIAVGVGVVLQLVMIAIGHFSPFVRNNVFAIGGMAISLIAGLVYAIIARQGWPNALLGAAAAGGGCAAIGIAASVALRDTAVMVLALGTLSSAATGAIGGAIGKAALIGRQ